MKEIHVWVCLLLYLHLVTHYSFTFSLISLPASIFYFLYYFRYYILDLILDILGVE